MIPKDNTLFGTIEDGVVYIDRGGRIICRVCNSTNNYTGEILKQERREGKMKCEIKVEKRWYPQQEVEHLIFWCPTCKTRQIRACLGGNIGIGCCGHTWREIDQVWTCDNPQAHSSFDVIGKKF